MTKTERSYFRVAKNVSELSSHPQHRIGAVVVDKHRIISSGYNSIDKYHRLQAELNKERFNGDNPGALHAEMRALLPIYKHKDLTNATLYVYREHADKTLAPSRPCPACMKMIKQCGIKKVCYTTNDGYAIETIKY